MYHGEYEYRAFQAGGNEKAMLRVAELGVVTTYEKYTNANSHNVGLKFVAMKWENSLFVQIKSGRNQNVEHPARKTAAIGRLTSDDLDSDVGDKI